MHRVIFDAPEHPNGGCIFDKFRDCRHVFDPPIHANGGCIFDNPGLIEPPTDVNPPGAGGGGSAGGGVIKRGPYGQVVIPTERYDTSLDDDVLAITMLLAVYCDHD